MLVPCVLVLSVATCAMARLPESVHQQWLVLPPGSPSNINTPAELELFRQHHVYYVSAWMLGACMGAIALGMCEGVVGYVASSLA